MSNDSALAPGAFGPADGSINTDTAAYEPPTYDEVFPPLEGAMMEPASIAPVGTPIATPQMPLKVGPSYANMAVKSSTITQVCNKDIFI